MLHKLEPKVDAAQDPAFRDKDDVTQTPTALTWKRGPSADSDHRSDTPSGQQRTPSSPRIPRSEDQKTEKLQLALPQLPSDPSQPRVYVCMETRRREPR